MFFKTMTGSCVIYLPLRFPTNGTNVHDTADKIRRSELLSAKALIHFDILSVLWPHTRHETSGFPWPAHCWAPPLFWHMPSMNTQKTCVQNCVMLLTFLHFTWCFLSSPCDLRFSVTLPCRTVVRVAPFDSHWSCVHRTLRIWNDQLAIAVQLHTSHRAHSLSSTTGGATGSKQSRFPPVTIKHLHCCPIIRFSQLLRCAAIVCWDIMSSVLRKVIQFHLTGKKKNMKKTFHYQVTVLNKECELVFLP